VTWPLILALLAVGLAVFLLLTLDAIA